MGATTADRSNAHSRKRENGIVTIMAERTDKTERHPGTKALQQKAAAALLDLMTGENTADLPSVYWTLGDHREAAPEAPILQGQILRETYHPDTHVVVMPADELLSALLQAWSDRVGVPVTAQFTDRTGERRHRMVLFEWMGVHVRVAITLSPEPEAEVTRGRA